MGKGEIKLFKCDPLNDWCNAPLAEQGKCGARRAGIIGKRPCQVAMDKIREELGSHVQGGQVLKVTTIGNNALHGFIRTEGMAAARIVKVSSGKQTLEGIL